MYKRRLAVLTATLAVALATFTGTASAALLSDLTALGYSVNVAWTTPNPAGGGDCTVYTISGYGISLYANSCDGDFQANVDSIADGHCNRRWQYEHPEQVDPWVAIQQLGWTTTADKCGDIFTVTNPNDQTVRYSGPGSGFVELAATIGAPPVPPPPPPAVVPPAPPAPTVVETPPVSIPAPEPPAPTPAPQTTPVVEVTATPAPAPSVPNEAVTTAPSVVITVTPAELKQLIDDAVNKAVAKAMKRQAKKRAARAQRPKPSSSPLKSRVRRR